MTEQPLDSKTMKVKNLKTDGTPMKNGNGLAKTALVVQDGKASQMPLKSASDALKPGNTVTFAGTKVAVTDANKNTDQVRGLKMMIDRAEAGDTRAQAISATTKKFPDFKAAPNTSTPVKR